jgi:hypothetical protein
VISALIKLSYKIVEIIMKMEPKDNGKLPQENRGEENHNPPLPPNINIDTDEGLANLRSLVNDLRGTRETSQESLATSLDVIVRPIACPQAKLTYIYEYIYRML